MVEDNDSRPTEYSGSPETGWVGRRPIGEGAYVVFTYGVPNSGTPEPTIHNLPDAGPEEMLRSAMINPETGEVYKTREIREGIARQLDMRHIPITLSRRDVIL